MKKSFLSIMVDFVLYPHGRAIEKSDTKSGIDLTLVANPTQYELERELELGNLTMGRCKGKSIVSDIYGALTEEDKKPASYSAIVDDFIPNPSPGDIDLKAKRMSFDILRQANNEAETFSHLSGEPLRENLARDIVENEERIIKEAADRYLNRVNKKLSDYNLKINKGAHGATLYYLECKKTCNIVRLVTFNTPYMFNNYGNEFKAEASYEVHQK